MITRDEILSEAVTRCMQELYSLAYPKISWGNFVTQNKEYSEKYLDGGNYKNGFTYKNVPPKPFEFYYLPKKIFKSVVDSYLHAYRIPPEIKETTSALIEYFENPVRCKWVEDKTDVDNSAYCGYKGYEKFSPLKELIGEENFNKVKEYVDEALLFYRWDKDEQYFNGGVYFGPSPSCNRENVIKNWKQWRGVDVVIPTDEEIANIYFDYE